MIQLSIILPFYKRVREFTRAMTYNHKYFAGHEVVLVLDEPTQVGEVMLLTRQYPDIKWVVILNEKDHAWRNPAPVINVGIRNASGEYVLIMSPESICVTDVPARLLEIVVKDNIYCLGHVCFCPEEDLAKGLEEANKGSKWLYGSICVKRAAMVAIRGYDEGNTKWGGDDDNIRGRLNMHGLHKSYVGKAQVLHPSSAARGSKTAPELGTPLKGKNDKFFHRPTEMLANNENWGTEFNNVIYHHDAALAHV